MATDRDSEAGTKEIKAARVMVVCLYCGCKHGLIRGKDSPIFYCRDERSTLLPDMEVKYEYS